VLAELERHAWPGNVRELRNYVERCAALRMLPASVADAAEPIVDASLDLATARDAFVRPHERRYLLGLLATHGGNVTSAARAAGVARSHFYRLLWRHGLAWEE
jgi:DNA-binding NtrC family response regulator